MLSRLLSTLLLSSALLSQTNVEAQTIITTAQVATHATPGDCWIIVSQKVYDFSAYVHPGGANRITPLCGKDGTAAYLAQPAVHTPNNIGQAVILKGNLGTVATPTTLRPVVVTPTTKAPVVVTATTKAPVVTQPTSKAAVGQTYTTTQVLTHSTPGDCWTILQSKVYDMTAYLNEHGGGAEQITPFCGKDATSAYLGRPASHTPTRIATLPTIILKGSLTGTSPATQPPASGISLAQLQQHSSVNDCWSVYFGQVYDQTIYMKTHSGGPDVMTPFCGKDGTSAYQTGNAAHAGAARIGTKLILKGTYTGGSPNNNNGGKISLATIATHATATDCWVMISGIAYDMTEYMSSHAGGTGPIIALCGQDATTGYVTQRGHSATRLARMVSVKNLGVVDGYNSDGSIATSNTSNFFTDNPIAAICIFVAVGGIALLVVLHFVTSYYHRRRLRLDAAIGGKMQKENMV